MVPRCVLFLSATALGLACFLTPTSAKSALAQRRGSLRAKVDPSAFQRELDTAMGEALGCGGIVGPDELAGLERLLAPTWHALPKNAAGRVERRWLRYLVQRHFSQHSAMVLRGFEPSRSASTSSSWGTADILSQRVPGYVESVLESEHAQEQGFDLRDAARVVATLEQLIFDAESALLEKVYEDQRRPTSRSLGSESLALVLEDYLVQWMMGEDTQGTRTLLANRTFLAEAFPHWDKLTSFARGQIWAIDFERQRTPRAISRPGHHALSPQYAFEDAHRVVGSITRSFSSFWESECISMKAALMEMDTHQTGRVPLSRFYSSALESEWRFGESESYLRELGALDEASGWRGKQVIIPNYIQAASNCIVNTPHYLICCANECEGLLKELEAAVGAPTAPPGQLLALVSNMTSQTTLDHDDPPTLDGALTQQLEQIAEASGGAVPLHGRLFAQWLHYTFPRECPFPHRQAATLTPLEFGDYLATGSEMERHAAAANESLLAVNSSSASAQEQWLSQWRAEEELLAGEAVDLPAPWESRRFALGCGGALASLLGVAALASATGRWPAGPVDAAPLLPTHAKAHFV